MDTVEEPAMSSVLAQQEGDYCTVCHSPATGSYNGEDYCDTHLQERMARETGVGY
jgi:hypothetical protein